MANSYYFDRHGDAPLRPTPTLEGRWRAGPFSWDAYRWDAPPAGVPEVQAVAGGSSSSA